MSFFCELNDIFISFNDFIEYFVSLKICANFTNSQKLAACLDQKDTECDFKKANECKNILNCQKIAINDNININDVKIRIYLFNYFYFKGLDYKCTTSFAERKIIGSNRNTQIF